MAAAGDPEPVVRAITGFVNGIDGPGGVPVNKTSPPRARPGWSAVTEGEWRVVVLAAEGHTNAEIADRLFLSRYTVETHLKHVFAKLGLRSRAELAAVAAAARSGALNT